MLSNNDYEKIISFGILLDKLKSVKRQNFKFGEEHENSAEHSWHIATLLLLFKEEFKDLDFEKMLSLALIHDVPEIISGDVCPFDKENYQKVKNNEEKISNKLYSELPESIAFRFKSLQNEFDNTTSKEAEVVKSIDKLQHLLQHLSSEKSSYKKWNVNSEMAKEYISKNINDEVSKKLLELLLPKAIERKVFPKI